MAKTALPKEARLKFKAARDFIKERDVVSARAELLGIELGSSFTLFHRMLAACAYISKDYELACSHIEQAMALDPDKQVLIADAIRIYKTKGDEVRTSQLFESFNLDKTDSAAELLRVALAMKSLLRYSEAAVALEKGLRLSPENTRIRDQYGIMLAMTDKPRDALQQWKFSLKFNPEDNLALVCLGRLYLHQNEFLKAIESFKEVLANEGGSAEGKKLNLIDAYIRASSMTEARAMLASVDGMEDNPRLHYLWGMLHYRSNDFALSFASFSRCISLGKERNHEVLSKIQWPDDFASDEELSRLIDNVHLTLGSVFDAFSMLEFSESTFDAQFNDATELINN
jgi:tetratricopeptide (TPR) repeat protein